jgi:hypothetical protein
MDGSWALFNAVAHGTNLIRLTLLGLPWLGIGRWKLG